MTVITISRQFGAGGKTLGEMIAKKLNVPFVDDAIIDLVAEKAKVSTHWVESMEKEAGGFLHKLISGMVSKKFIDRILDDNRGYIDEEIYVDTLHKVITKIAEDGNAVILGRGSQYILKDFKNAYHVLFVADNEDRVQFMVDRYHFSASKSLQVVNREDRRRANLYKKFGKEDYDQPALYHLVLNMSRIDMESACNMVTKLATS
jgi:cytidylate kinase